MNTMERTASARFSYDEALRHHIDKDYDEWDIEEDERLESETAWEAAFEHGEELALEEQTTMGAGWDED